MAGLRDFTSGQAFVELPGTFEIVPPELDQRQHHCRYRHPRDHNLVDVLHPTTP